MWLFLWGGSDALFSWFARCYSVSFPVVLFVRIFPVFSVFLVLCGCLFTAFFPALSNIQNKKIINWCLNKEGCFPSYFHWVDHFWEPPSPISSNAEMCENSNLSRFIPFFSALMPTIWTTTTNLRIIDMLVLHLFLTDETTACKSKFYHIHIPSLYIYILYIIIYTATIEYINRERERERDRE